jgi:hypothetical protein
MDLTNDDEVPPVYGTMIVLKVSRLGFDDGVESRARAPVTSVAAVASIRATPAASKPTSAATPVVAIPASTPRPVERKPVVAATGNLTGDYPVSSPAASGPQAPAAVSVPVCGKAYPLPHSDYVHLRDLCK